MDRKILPVTVFVIVASASCADVGAPKHDDVRLIHEAYEEWEKATNARDIEWWSTFVAPNAVFLPPGSSPLETIDEIRAYYSESFRDPAFSLACTQTLVEVADSRDIAWARGICEATFTTPVGDVENGTSKWIKIWIRMDDGTWKCKLNTWNYNESG